MQFLTEYTIPGEGAENDDNEVVLRSSDTDDLDTSPQDFQKRGPKNKRKQDKPTNRFRRY